MTTIKKFLVPTAIITILIVLMVFSIHGLTAKLHANTTLMQNSATYHQSIFITILTSLYTYLLSALSIFFGTLISHYSEKLCSWFDRFITDRKSTVDQDRKELQS